MELSKIKNSLLLNTSNQMLFIIISPCLISYSTINLGKLATAEVLLPLTGSGVDLGSLVLDDKRVVGVHRELQHHSIYTLSITI